MKITIRKPQAENLLLLFYLLLPVLRDFIFSHLPNGYYLMDMMLAVMILYCAYKNSKYYPLYLDILLFYGVIVFLFAFKFLSDPSIRVWLTREFGVRHMLIMGGIFGYGVMRVQKDTDKMLMTLKTAGIVLAFYYAYKSLEVLRYGYWRYYQFGRYWQNSSNMSWSYGVLLTICLLCIFIVIDKKIVFVAPVALGLLGIMAYGSRGTIVAFAAGVLFMVLFVSEGKLKLRNYIITALLLIAAIALFLNIGLTVLTNLFNRLGLSSRFLELFTAQQTFAEASSGRSVIWLHVIEFIKTGPFFGRGVFGERNTVYDLGFQWGYSHNIALEIFAACGWLMGGLIIIAMVVGIFRFLYSVTDKKEKMIFIIFLTASFELLVSSTLWLHYGIWCLFGLYVNHFKGKKIKYQYRRQVMVR